MLTHAHIAQVAHEVNRAFCGFMGDDSQAPWAQAPDWQKESAIAGVKFHQENPEAGPEGSHESWLAQKEADGWKLGPVKDAEKKEHPAMVPYSELPDEQRAKDHLYTAVVRTMLGIAATMPVQDGEGVLLSTLLFSHLDRLEGNPMAKMRAETCANHLKQLGL